MSRHDVVYHQAESLDLDLDSHSGYVSFGATITSKTFGKHHQRTVLGLQSPEKAPNAHTIPNAFNATLSARILSRGRMPRSLLVIERQHSGDLSCLDCATGRVVSWSQAAGVRELAETFEEYIANVAADTSDFDRGWERFKEHVRSVEQRFKYDRIGSGSLPRSRNWRPYRCCVQDVLVGATVVRYQEAGNMLEVDVFLTAEIPELEPQTGARALSVFLLGEAVRLGTTMQVRFTENVEGGRIPRELSQFASSRGVELGRETSGSIAPDEAVRLSLALTDVSKEQAARLGSMAESGAIALEGICHTMLAGVWTPTQVDILLFASEPGRVITRPASAWEPLLRSEDVYFARAAVMAGSLVRRLERPSDVGVGQDLAQSNNSNGARQNSLRSAKAIEELEDGARELAVSVTAQPLGMTIGALDGAGPLDVPWVSGSEMVTAHQLKVVLVPDFGLTPMGEMLAAIDACAASRAQQGDAWPIALLLPGDYASFPFTVRGDVESHARSQDVFLLVMPASLHEIDLEVQRRLSLSARHVRQ